MLNRFTAPIGHLRRRDTRRKCFWCSTFRVLVSRLLVFFVLCLFGKDLLAALISLKRAYLFHYFDLFADTKKVVVNVMCDLRFAMRFVVCVVVTR
jgi:hypothetical protein